MFPWLMKKKRKATSKQYGLPETVSLWPAGGLKEYRGFRVVPPQQKKMNISPAIGAYGGRSYGEVGEIVPALCIDDKLVAMYEITYVEYLRGSDWGGSDNREWHMKFHYVREYNESPE